MASKNVMDAAKKVNLAELAKRVPPNQELQFAQFKAKCEEYQARVNKLPSEMPRIDWEFYMMNVKPEMKKWVEEFQEKYKNLSESFNARANRDYSKYYCELEEASAAMKAEIENFKCESDERIKKLQQEYDSIKALKPYADMTMEEYCELLPDKKMYTYEGRPSFWPHTAEEQSLERPEVHDHDHGDGHSAAPKDDGGKGKPPKGGSDQGGSTGGASSPAAASSTGGGNDGKKAKIDDKPMKSAMKGASASAIIKKVKFAEPKVAQKSRSSETVRASTSEVSLKPTSNTDLPESIVSEIADGIASKSDMLGDILKKSDSADSIVKKPDFSNGTIEEQIRSALFPAQFHDMVKKVRQGHVAPK